MGFSEQKQGCGIGDDSHLPISAFLLRNIVCWLPEQSYLLLGTCVVNWLYFLKIPFPPYYISNNNISLTELWMDYIFTSYYQELSWLPKNITQFLKMVLFYLGQCYNQWQSGAVYTASLSFSHSLLSSLLFEYPVLLSVLWKSLLLIYAAD